MLNSVDYYVKSDGSLAFKQTTNTLEYIVKHLVDKNGSYYA